MSVSETTPETKIAAPIVTANSCSRRPRIPPIKSTGMNTATSEIVIEMMVKPISREPFRAAVIGCSPASMWRTMFSSITMASSTTKPTESVRASREMLLMLKPQKYITPKVPTMAIGIAILGMIVAERVRRNRKITNTTSRIAISRWDFTSRTDSRIASERSRYTSSLIESGSCAWNAGSSALIPSTTAMVFIPGWRWTESRIARRGFAPVANSGSSVPSSRRRWSNQLADFSFSTPSSTRATSPRRTAAPLR